MEVEVYPRKTFSNMKRNIDVGFTVCSGLKKQSMEIDISKQPVKPVCKIRKVSFSLKPTITVFESDYDRRLGAAVFRGLSRKCSDAQREIYQIMNRMTTGGFIPLCNDEDDKDEDPIKVNTPSILWDKDESPMELLHIWKTTPSEAWKMVEVLERNAIKVLPKTHISASYQGIHLLTRCSGKKFQRPVETLTTIFVIVRETYLIGDDSDSESEFEKDDIEEPMKNPEKFSTEVNDLLMTMNSFSLMPNSFNFEF
jgi:hypothetical protein